MAEEKIAIPANPEKIEVKSNHTRRNSTGNLHISKERLKILPRYLRASLGSCHDFCKYGVEDSLEKKARSPIPRQITERSGDGQDQDKDVNLEEIKNKLQIKPKALPDSKSLTNQKHHQVIKKEAQISAKKVAVSLKRFSLPGNIMDICAEHIADLRPKPVEIKPSFSSTLANISSRRYDPISTSKAVGVLQESPVGGSRNGGKSHFNASKEMKLPKSRKKEDFAAPAVSLSFSQSIKREFSAKSGNDKDLKNLSRVKDNGRKAECKKTIDQNIPEKTLYVIERKLQNPTENVIDATRFSPSLYPSFEDKKFECDRNGIHSSRSPPSFENKQLRHSRNGGHATCPSSSSPLSTYKNGLRRSQIGNHNTPPSSPTPKTVKSDPLSGGSIKTKRVGIVSLDDKVGSPEKINFRRGKADDVLSKTTSPRKLRFKQRRVLCENQNGKADPELRSLKEVVAVDDLSGSKTEPMELVLKHQDVEGKKWGQNLFNNVIEETASKLVETRKSKVRALVDAFETVISLQDTKSSATTNVYRVA
ncbi:hypothetical protein RHSIM_Rhsim12G0153000 [Rhododendron simsii]|uniref:Calmodulin-binding domain-containing protein n=1 Tax=Rhododendron simsii TaxID=118357 RepID=A0A834G187_RHOSS|nr:hypothetical protein RHSIM_Rhsim12G0153000 [Rhododendron simsii]